MSHEPNNIDQLLRERLEGFEMAPPADVWTNTSAALNATRRKRKMFVWFFGFTGALVLLIAGLWYFNGTPSENILAKEELTSTDSGKRALESGQSNDENSEQKDLKRTKSSKKSSDESADRNSQRSGTSVIKKSHGTSQNKVGAAKNKAKSERTGGLSQTQWADKKPAKLGTKPPTNSLNSAENDGRASTTPSLSVNEPMDKNFTLFTIGSLPIMDLNPLPRTVSSPVNSSISVRPLLSNIPFWKRFSVESSIGSSSYRIRASASLDSAGLPLADASTDRHSFDARLGMNYHFKKGFSLQTGLEYSAAKENYTFESSETTTMTYNDTISSYFDTTLNQTVYVIGPISFDTTITVQTATQNYYKMLTLPFQFAWKMEVSPRSELEFALGGAVSIYGKNSGITIVDNANATIPTSEAYQTKGILSLGGSIKYLQRFGLHHALYIEPWARLGITSLSMPVLLYAVRRDHYGIRVGYRFYFDSRKHN